MVRYLLTLRGAYLRLTIFGKNRNSYDGIKLTDMTWDIILVTETKIWRSIPSHSVYRGETLGACWCLGFWRSDMNRVVKQNLINSLFYLLCIFIRKSRNSPILKHWSPQWAHFEWQFTFFNNIEQFVIWKVSLVDIKIVEAWKALSFSIQKC